MKWKRYTLTQTPSRPLRVFGEIIDYSITPSDAIAKIWRFLSGQSRAPRHEHPNEYVCLGLVFTRQTEPYLTQERALHQAIMSDTQDQWQVGALVPPTDPHRDTLLLWDYWNTLDESAIVDYGSVIEWMANICEASLSNTHEVFMGYHDETKELIQLRIRYFDVRRDTNMYTKELVIIRHDDQTFPNERSLFMNPLTTDLESHSEYLWESFNSRVDHVPNIPDQNIHINVSYMMPYEEE